jgi:hypothetical protein
VILTTANYTGKVKALLEDQHLKEWPKTPHGPWNGELGFSSTGLHSVKMSPNYCGQKDTQTTRAL